jgi:hypothetical protein
LRKLRLSAALIVLTYSAFFPLLFPTSASASELNQTYTLAEYNAAYAAAQKAVTDAQAAVDSATALYNESVTPVLTPTGTGLNADVYNNTMSRTPDVNNLCETTTVSTISEDWGDGSVMGCDGDQVTVHYYGTITVPVTGSYTFRAYADDGFYMTINNQVVINEWYDKGCEGNWGYSIELTAGTAYPIDAWFYENGGGACALLYYQNETNMSSVPSSWFGTQYVTTYLLIFN